MPKDEKQISTPAEKTEGEITPAVENIPLPEHTLSAEEIQNRAEEFEQTRRVGEESDKVELAETRVELDEHFNKEKAKIFVEQELAGEERIEQPMDPECQVSVVIPAYGERDSILRPLGSLAEQQDIDPNQFEVIFVVNHPSDAQGPTETDEFYELRMGMRAQRIKENEKTLELFESIKNGSNKGVEPEEQDIVDLIRKSGLKFHVIDKSSDGKELPKEYANVGGARNRGVCEAVERFLEIDRNGIVAQTDSDTRLPPDYIRSLIDVFEKNPEAIGVRGDLHFDTIEGESLPPEQAVIREMEWLYGVVAYGMAGRVQEKESGKKTQPKIEFTGANMASRAFEAALAGGVPKHAKRSGIGGEDTEFGRNLAEIGKTIRAPGVLTYPLERPSERTSTGHGTAIIRAKKSMEKGEITKVESFERISFETGIGAKIAKVFSSGNKSLETLRPVLTFGGQGGEQVLDDSQMQEVISYLSSFKKFPSGDEIAQDPRAQEFGKIMRRNLDRLAKKKPVVEAFPDLKEAFMKNPDLAVRFESATVEVEERLNEEDKKAKFGGKIISAIFSEGVSKTLSPEKLGEIVENNSSDSGLSPEVISNIAEDNEAMEMFCKAIAGSRDVNQALANFKRIFSINTLPSVDEAIKSDYVSLSAMRDILEGENK